MFCVTTPDDEAARLEPRERVVRGIREDARPDERLGPALPDARRDRALSMSTWPSTIGIEPLPEAARRAEVGQAAGGRDARAGQREHGRVALEEAREHLGVGIGDHAEYGSCGMTVALSLIAAVAWTMANYWLVPLSRSVDPYVASLLILVGNGLCTIPLGAGARRPPRQRRARAARLCPARRRAGGLRVPVLLPRPSRSGDLAVVAPIIGLEGGIAALTVFAFGERVSALVVLGLAIALLGGCLAASAGGRRTAAGALPAPAPRSASARMFALYAAAEDLGPVSVVGAGRLSALALLGVLVLWRRGALAGPRRQRAPALARRARRHRLRLLLVRRLARPRERRRRGGGAVLDAQRGGRDRAPARAAPAASVRRHRPRRASGTALLALARL